MPTQLQQQTAKAQKVIDRYNNLKKDKQLWINDWEYLSHYVMRRKYGQGNQYGAFTTTEIFDNTAIRAKSFLVSSLIGALWPNGSKTISIVPPDGMKDEVAWAPEVKEFYERSSTVIQSLIDDPEAGFQNALEEYMNDQVVFGISGLYVEDTQDPSMPVRFSPVDAKKVCISEGKDGYVDTVYVERELTLRQLVLTYGEFAVSDDRMKQYQNNVDIEQKIKVLEVVEPRRDGVKDGIGNASMPVASVHIDMEKQWVLKESGYPEMPIFMTRFWKYMGELYGRSPSGEALPDILELNAMREALIIAVEKKLDPPLALMDADALGGGTVNTTAGALNIFNVSGRNTSSHPSPLLPIVDIGSLEDTYKRLSEVEDNVEQSYMIDRLSDLNNDQRMTAAETNIRNELRTQSLNTVYSRQISECFVRMIQRVYNIAFNNGLLGVIEGSFQDLWLQQNGVQPDYIPQQIVQLIQQKKHAYKIHMISPAARAMKQEELAGITTVLQTCNEIGQVDPTIYDYVNFDRTLHRIQELRGAPSDILNDLQTVQQIRQARSDQQQKQAQIEGAKTQAETARAGAKAILDSAKAGIPPQVSAQMMAGGQAA